MKRYDVIVAGAGPTGSTAATLLARRGYSVLLLDRQAFPRDKTCAAWVNRLAFERFDYLSRVAAVTGLRQSWTPTDYVLCANEDIPFEPARIRAFYGQELPLLIAPRFAGIQGYAWIFAKRTHICVGIGCRIAPDLDLRELFTRWVGEARGAGLLPEAAQPRKTEYAVDPAGAVCRGGPLVRGRVLLVGDAGGFVSGSTGEGIYPGMVSAECAAAVIHRALASSSPEPVIAEFQEAWKRELGDYLRPLPGGERKQQTHRRLGLLFRSRWAARIAARAFLYGERSGLRTAWRAL